MRWRKVEAPFKHVSMNMATGASAYTACSAYWLFSVIERAKSTDPEKIIKVWEGDIYQYPNGKIVKMRACDHKTIQPYEGCRVRPAAKAEGLHVHSALLLVPRHIARMARNGSFRRARSCRRWIRSWIAAREE